MSNKDDPRLAIARRNMKLALALRDMTAADASRKAGLSRNALSQFTSGKTSLSYVNMLAVCDALNVPIGVMHEADSITESHIKLYLQIDRMSDDAIRAALQEPEI